MIEENKARVISLIVSNRHLLETTLSTSIDILQHMSSENMPLEMALVSDLQKIKRKVLDAIDNAIDITQSDSGVH